MSKNITIQEGGVAKQLTADKLKTNLVGSGTCLWVPEDEVQLTTKTITENGTYKASDDGYYGYEQVIVSGVGSVTGTDPTTGEDTTVTTGPTGELESTVLPSSIAVVTPPTNPYGIYTDGQAITKDGMIVKGYLKSGEEWGTVPNNEITLDPTAADYSKITGGRTSEVTEFNVGPWPQPVVSVLGAATTIDAGTGEALNTWSVDGYIAFRTNAQGKTNGGFLATDRPGVYGSRTDKNGRTTTYLLNETYTYNGKTVYFYSAIEGYNETFSPSNMSKEADNLRTSVNQAAWTVVYGTVTQISGVQPITVSWPRPGDGATLETSFDILVAPPYSTDDN